MTQGRLIIFAIAIFISLIPLRSQADTNDFSMALSEEVNRVITRYSAFLDSQWSGTGWKYSVPSKQYREMNQDSAGSVRMQATFASFYRFRQDESAKEKVRIAVRNAFLDVPLQQANHIRKGDVETSTRSFNDIIGIYLGLQILHTQSELFPWIEHDLMLSNMKEMFPWALKAHDTENRALLGAAFGTAVLKHPLLSFTDQEKKEYEGLIRAKVQEGLKSIGRDNVYREGKPKRFSLHYHLVSANMLFSLCKELSDQKYCSIADRMTKVVRRWFPKGKLSWKGSFRPRGIGLQTVLLRALAEQSSGNSRWKEYWDIEKLRRGFIDPRVPNRLVWKDEVDKTLNDDYSFSSMAAFLVFGD